MAVKLRNKKAERERFCDSFLRRIHRTFFIVIGV
jgi:hypothetical protein